MEKTCEYRVVAVHVHGHDADIEAFFDALGKAFDKVIDDVPALFPSIEVIEDEEDMT